MAMETIIKPGRGRKPPGRPRKYMTEEAAYLARLANNKKWRLENPKKWKKILARSYQRRKARLLEAGREQKGIVVSI